MLRQVILEHGDLRVVAMDSISIITEEDRGQVIVAASNGGAASGDLASRFSCALVALNDAGIGKDRAGIAGLVAIDRDGIPGVGISHDSAEISNGLDTWQNGVISFANASAKAAGFEEGEQLNRAVLRFVERHQGA